MFKVKMTGFNGVKAEFASASKNVREIVDQEITSMGKKWRDGAIKDAPGDQGTLRKGISFLVTNNGVEIFSNVFYSPFMEFGTKGKYRPIPGTEAIAAQFKGFKNGDIMQMLRMIVKWVHRKGITGRYSVKTRKRLGSKVNQFAEDYSAAWPILLSILKKGVTPHPFFFKQQDVVWPEMVRNVKRRIEQGQKVTVIMPGEIMRPKIITI
jgi:hypothetical protein